MGEEAWVDSCAVPDGSCGWGRRAGGHSAGAASVGAVLGVWRCLLVCLLMK